MKATPPPSRPCIVTSIELLGFDDPSMPEGRRRGALERVERHLADPETSRIQGSRVFTAGRRVTRVAPIQRGGPLLFWELLDIVHAQSELLVGDILLRGAVTLGDVAARADFAFGPGITEAERLRDEIADVPRVIVDPRVIREVEENPDLRAAHHTPSMELGYIRELLREDADGLWFVDYLRAFASEVDEPSMYLDFLGEHRSLIDRRIEAAQTLDRSTRGWTWLRRYHNSVIDQLRAAERISKGERARLRLRAYGPLLYAFPPPAKAP